MLKVLYAVTLEQTRDRALDSEHGVKGSFLGLPCMGWDGGRAGLESCQQGQGSCADISNT